MIEGPLAAAGLYTYKGVMSYSRFVAQLLVDNRGEGERGPQMLFEIWQSAFFIKKMGGETHPGT